MNDVTRSVGDGAAQLGSPTFGARKTSSPAFEIRGIIEGFYGVPWTHEQRLDMVRFIAARGMNTFVYAPKDDWFVRKGWREQYTGSELDNLGELIDVCRELGVELVYCLSPGLSIRYSSETDLDRLVTKFESVASLGVSFFGLLLDDIPEQLQHEQDLAEFSDLVEAQQRLISGVFDRLIGTGDDRRLVVCPTQYFGYGDERYISRLGSSIDERIELFWTGRLICSPTLDLPDAEVFARSTGRQPLYWDNYPVNDVAMTHELHIGPYRGRDPLLHTGARGIIANGMEFVESSKIAFATIADYLWSPADYDPEASWNQALGDVVGNGDVAGEADVAAFRLFADNVRSSCLSLDDAPMLTAALERFAFLNEIGRASEASEVIAALAERFSTAADHLLDGPVANRALIDEARPWIESFRTGAEALGVLARLAAEGRLEADATLELREFRDRLVGARRRVFGDALDMTLAELVDPIARKPTTATPTHPVPPHEVPLHRVPTHKEAAQ